MKPKFLIIFFSTILITINAQSIHTHSNSEDFLLHGIDYIESVLKLLTKVLSLDKRMPRNSPWLEYKMGFFDAGFKF